MKKKRSRQLVATRHVDGKVDLSGWTLSAFDEFNKCAERIIQKAASEALQVALNDEDARPHIYWPAEWDEFNSDGRVGRKVADPLTIHLVIGLDAYEGVARSFSLRDALAHDIAVCREDGSYAAGLRRIRDALRELADEIDGAVTTAGTTQPTTTSKKKGRRR